MEGVEKGSIEMGGTEGMEMGVEVGRMEMGGHGKGGRWGNGNGRAWKWG